MENKSFLREALLKAEKALEATPEYKDWDKAKKAKREAWEVLYEAEEAKDEAMKAEKEAWKAVEATPAYKPYKEAKKAYRKAEEALFVAPEHQVYLQNLKDLKERKAK